MPPLELTFAILKPHIVKNPVAVGAIRNTILTSNFKVAASKRHAFTLREAQAFYSDHAEKFFYNRLITFMTSGPSDMMILARVEAIKTWRQLMGPTKVFRTQFEAPDTIRGRFGLSDTRNATHGSDSLESVEKEAALFFPEFSIPLWYQECEPSFRSGEIVFDEDNFLHRLNKEIVRTTV